MNPKILRKKVKVRRHKRDLSNFDKHTDNTGLNRNMDRTDPIPRNSEFSPSDGQSLKSLQEGSNGSNYGMMPSMMSSIVFNNIRLARIERKALMDNALPGGFNNSTNPQYSENGAQAPGFGAGESPDRGVEKAKGYDLINNLSESIKRWVSEIRRNRKPFPKDQTHLDSAGD